MAGDRPLRAYRLPDTLRLELAAPFGPVVDTAELDRRLGGLAPGTPVAAVGDVVSLTLKRLGFRPALFVCDHRTQRGENDPDLARELTGWADRELRVENPPGLVLREAWDAVVEAFAAPLGTTVCLLVDGEEDLLGLPVFLEAPEGAVVLYGMPGQGVVWAPVDAGLRARVRELVGRLERL